MYSVMLLLFFAIQRLSLQIPVQT